MKAHKSRLKQAGGALGAALRTLGLLFLALCVLQPIVYSQEAGSPPAEPTQAGAQGPDAALAPAPQAAGGTEAPAETLACDASNPIPGQRAKVRDDDEIFLVERTVPGTYGIMQTAVLNYDPDSVGSELTEIESIAWAYNPSLAIETYWLAAAAGDLNGTADGHRRDGLVAGFRNAVTRVGALAVPYQTYSGDDWWGDYGGRTSGTNVWWVDAAAGNLDMSADESDEAVLAFHDDLDDYHVLALGGDSGGNIGTADDTVLYRYWEDHHPGRERGAIESMSVATGDLNGDGYNNEVVTAFRDSGGDLQVVVLRPDSSVSPATFTSIFYWDGYTGNPKLDTITSTCDWWRNWRPIDVATGDLDGDYKDEVVVATRSGNCNNDGVIELLVFDFNAEDPTTHNLTVDTTYRIPGQQVDVGSNEYESAPTVSIGAADLDGDGYDEIALGYMMEFWRTDANFHEVPLVRTYDYIMALTPEAQQYCPSEQQACTRQRAAYGNFPAYDFPKNTDELRYARLSLATGDVDRDGQAEIALARINPSNKETVDLYVLGVSGDGSTISVQDSMTWNAEYGETWDLAIAMGDYDEDAVWGTYAGTCHDKGDALVMGVMHAPPFYPEGSNSYDQKNDYDTYAKFAANKSKGYTTGQSIEATIGGSTQTEKSFKGVTASFTREWERSTSKSQEKTQTTSFGLETHTGAPVWKEEGGSWSSVLAIVHQQYCYDYNATIDGQAMVFPVCVTSGTGFDNIRTSSWYMYDPVLQIGGRYKYADSWVPVGMNLAEEANPQTQRIAYQRSSWTSYAPLTGFAYRANDGNTDGVYSNGHVSRTDSEWDPYWQVDMGGLQWIDAVQLWNRTDCCTSELSNFYVLVTRTNWPTACSVGGATCACDDPTCMKEQPGIWDTYYSGEAGRPTVIPVNDYGRRVRIQRETGSGTGYLSIAEMEVYGMPGTPDQWPKAITPDPLPSDGATSFTLTWRNNRAQAFNRPLYLVWSSSIWTKGGTEGIEYSTGTGTEEEQVKESGKSHKLRVGLEVRKKREASFGINQKKWQGISWGKELVFAFNAEGLGDLAPGTMDYSWRPYLWTQQQVPEGGGIQEFLVLDYIAPDANVIPPPEEGAPADQPAPEEQASGSGPLVAPLAPLVDSPTHPDPDTWYASNDVVVTWAQPPTETVPVENYDWSLDRYPDTVPVGHHYGLPTTATFTGLDQGVWYVHVRAGNDQDEWGETGHRMVHVDAQPPQVSLAVDPPAPTGNGTWYVTPLAVTVIATDTVGSGVTGIEVSTDGAAWQPYTGPLPFGTDTPGTTVYARATDLVGNVSEPVTTTFRIDLTPPDSHVDGGVGPGTWVAEVTTDTTGNDMLVLAGSIADNLSGRAGMVLDNEGPYWSGAGTIGAWPLPSDPSIELNWIYTGTRDIGAGYHIFTGRAVDEAGNQEAAYEIGRVKWFPKASPDLGGSSVEPTQTIARPGDEILFSLVGRNAGFQEAYVGVTAALPTGLEPVVDRLPPGVVYDPATRILTWPPRLMWPGWALPYMFLGQVDAGLGATTLEVEGTFHAFWPNTDLLPDEERQIFEDLEQTVTASTSIAVNPALPAEADLVPPWSYFMLPERPLIAGAEWPVKLVAAPDASRMFLREWTLDPTSGDWVAARDSGWIDYTPTLTWTLSAGQGVKYLGVWMADAAGNVAPLMEPNLAFVNRMDASQVLADGQRLQYRGIPQKGDRVSLVLTTVSGDPDAYLWAPRNGFWPYPYSNATLPPGEPEYLTRQFDEPGRYLLEIHAVGDSEYTLELLGEEGEAAAAGIAALQKALPENPLTWSDPLSAGQLGPAVTLNFRIYLPVVFRNY